MLFSANREPASYPGKKNEVFLWKAAVACTMLAGGCACMVLSLLCAKSIMKEGR